MGKSDTWTLFDFDEGGKRPKAPTGNVSEGKLGGTPIGGSGNLGRTPTGGSGKMWIADAAATKAQINNIVELYNHTIKACIDLGDYLDTIVCRGGYWNDNSGEVFAKWWNQSSASAGASGKIKYDKAMRKLSIVASDSDDTYDGEDRIKAICQRAGRAFYLGVCVPLGELKYHYEDNSKKWDKSYQGRIAALANNPTYKGKKDFKGLTWSQLMEEAPMNCQKWKRHILQSTIADGGHKENLAEEAENIKNKINVIHSFADEFRKAIKKAYQNTSTESYWGFSDRSSIDEALRALHEKIDKGLNELVTNFCTALEGYSTDQKDAIAILKKLLL